MKPASIACVSLLVLTALGMTPAGADDGSQMGRRKETAGTVEEQRHYTSVVAQQGATDAQKTRQLQAMAQQARIKPNDPAAVKACVAKGGAVAKNKDGTMYCRPHRHGSTALQ